MKSTLNILIAVRALIERRENWCQRALQDGPAFCIRGAIIKVVGIKHESDLLIALAHALPADFKPHDWPVNRVVDYTANRVVDYNNTHTHAEILAVVDRAMAAERQKLGLDDKITAQVQAILANTLASAQERERELAQ